MGATFAIFTDFAQGAWLVGCGLAHYGYRPFDYARENEFFR
ncbi:MAG: hypothetical protein ACOCUP_00055 [bacterium]